MLQARDGDTNTLRLAALVALAVAYLHILHALADSFLGLIVQTDDDFPGVFGRLLHLEVGGYQLYYGDAVSWTIAFLVGAATFAVIARLRRRD